MDNEDTTPIQSNKYVNIDWDASLIDKDSPVPIYYQLKQYIIDKINKEEWPQDSLIPSERELADAFKISRMTIRQAIGELVTEGLLYRQRGRGTFVAQPKIEQSDVMSFTEAALNHGFKASTEVRRFDIILPAPSILDKLGLPEGEKVYYVQRLRMINNMIIAVEDVYLPLKYTGNLTRNDFTGSIYRLLKDKYDYAIDHVSTAIEAVIPGDEEMHLFQAKKSIPVLKVTAVHITNRNMKLYYEESIYRSDKFLFNVNIYKR